ncbi:hypothetical protein KSP39_PZI021908 [Platanthera zijinensis]|uniref:Integrase catalytic domain-containing protein n=1 Tax=Platanthera zijinensis TaxID=2320716 RepID=A0AAP0AWU4_9ASPA
MVTIRSNILQQVRDSWAQDVDLQRVVTQKKLDPASCPKYTWANGLLKRKGRLVVGKDPKLKETLLKLYHDGAVGGHSGINATYRRLKNIFYWKRMKPEVYAYIQQCGVCQQCKVDTQKPMGLLQPLPIPSRVWQDISLDFIEGLPKSKGMTTILVVVDRLSKQAHFSSLSHPYTAQGVAQLFLDSIVRLHGLPASIVSDRDTSFLSQFWQEIFTILGVQLKFSTAYHPQTDGQTEVVNRCLEGYLRCMCFERPRTWATWLPLAEWWYNTTYHTAIKMTPYEVVYGQEPAIHIPYISGEARTEEVDRSLEAREKVISLLKTNLAQAQNRMRVMADKKRRERTLEVGSWAYVRLQPYKQTSLRNHGFHKLSPRFFGPFRVLERIGTVAYKLELPTDAKIRHTFHVSQLREHVVDSPFQPLPLPNITNSEGNLMVEPQGILKRRIAPNSGKVMTQVLVQWLNGTKEEATWEELESFKRRYLYFIIP